MTTFFQALGRIIQGKPVYGPNDEQPPEPLSQYPEPPSNSVIQNPLDQPIDASAQPQQQPTETPSIEEPHIQKDDAGTFPIMTIKRSMTRVNGDNMQVYAYIVNNSQMALELHKTSVLGREEEIRHPMRPGDNREFLIYDGPLVTGTNDHEALLLYKTEDGNYFEAIHEIRFTINQVTKLYSIDEMRLRLPIRPLYGLH